MVTARQPRSAGFTTIELVIAVTIIGILTAMAAPAMSEMVAKQRLRTTSSELFTSLVRARSQAIKSAVDVSVLPVNTDWNQGWTIPDPNPANSISTLETHAALRNITVTGPASVVFRANGRLRTAASPTFQIAASGTTAVRCVAVDLGGRAYMKNTTCSP